MMYLIVLFGCLLGMLLTTVVQSEIINQSQKFDAGFNDAFRFYTKINRGAIYSGFITILIFIFVMPNIIDMGIEKFISRIRIYSVGLGVVSQALGFLIVKRSHEKLDQKINKL